MFSLRPRSVAPMAELVDASDSKSDSARSAGSIPARGTKNLLKTMICLRFRQSTRAAGALGAFATWPDRMRRRRPGGTPKWTIGGSVELNAAATAPLFQLEAGVAHDRPEGAILTRARINLVQHLVQHLRRIEGAPVKPNHLSEEIPDQIRFRVLRRLYR